MEKIDGFFFGWVEKDDIFVVLFFRLDVFGEDALVILVWGEMGSIVVGEGSV